MALVHSQPPAQPNIEAIEAATDVDDPEAVLRRHLRETQRLATRLLRFEEDLTIATESGLLDHPGAVIKALQQLERTRSSVAYDLRSTSETLNRVILERYRSGIDCFNECSQQRPPCPTK